MKNVGIDVSAKSLTVHIYGAKQQRAEDFANTSAGHKQLTSYISNGKKPIRVCLEATGTYHFDLALYLHVWPNIDIMVMNPKCAKNFAVSLNRPDKTDAADAAVLAEHCARMEFVSWKKPRDEYIRLRGFSRHLASMTHHLVQLKNQLHAVSASTEYGIKEVIRSHKQLIRTYERQIDVIEKNAVAFIRSKPKLEKYFALLCSVKGIATKSAIQLLGELLVLPEGLTKEQWVRHAGLNPCLRKSGTSINKKPQISKAGNRHLRTALFMPALSAMSCDPYVRGFVAHLVEDNGLRRIQAVCAVMRKMLHAIHGMMEKEMPYDNTRFFAKPLMKPLKVEEELAELA